MSKDLHISKKETNFALQTRRSETRLHKTEFEKHRGVEQLAARQAHNLEVARSSRVSATK